MSGASLAGLTLSSGTELLSGTEWVGELLGAARSCSGLLGRHETGRSGRCLHADFERTPQSDTTIYHTSPIQPSMIQDYPDRSRGFVRIHPSRHSPPRLMKSVNGTLCGKGVGGGGGGGVWRGGGWGGLPTHPPVNGPHPLKRWYDLIGRSPRSLLTPVGANRRIGYHGNSDCGRIPQRVNWVY